MLVPDVHPTFPSSSHHLTHTHMHAYGLSGCLHGNSSIRILLLLLQLFWKLPVLRELLTQPYQVQLLPGHSSNTTRDSQV